MKQLFREKGFMIRSVDYGDHHRIISCLTQNLGRVDLMALGARNSRRRFSGSLDFLNLINIEFEENSRGSLQRLREVELLEGFPNIRKDYERTIIALTWLRLLSRSLLHQGEVSGLFSVLEESLHSLTSLAPDWVDVVFRRRLLSTLGYHLELHHCVQCQQDGDDCYFSADKGGLVCQNCARHLSTAQRLCFYPKEWWNLGRAFEANEESKCQVLRAKEILTEAYREYLGVSTVS